MAHLVGDGKVVPSFWKDKRVFLTGHTGFKGSWMAIWLNQMGAKVTGLALPPPTQPSLFEQAHVGDLLHSNICDIRDYKTVSKLVEAAQPEIVLHMAAQPLVRYSYANPVETYEVNVMGTVHLLEAVRNCTSVKAVVNITTDKCYENREWPWGYREIEAMGGHDPYSSSKGCSELITTAYRLSYFQDIKDHPVALASARAGNVVGGGDWAMDRLIPDIMRAITQGQPVEIRSPRAIRPWQHVLEPLSGYLVLAQNLFQNGQEFAQAFNFGPAEDDAREVEYIVRTLSQLWGDGASFRLSENQSDLHEAFFLKLDCSKAKALLGWSPRWKLDETLRRIVSWNLQYTKNPKLARSLCLSEIADYIGGT